MKIALSYRVDYYPQGKEGLSARQLGKQPSVPVESYARCVHRAFEALGHTVENVYGHNTVWCPQHFDIYIELDNGRDAEGNLGFGSQFDRSDIQLNIPTVVWFVDSHGHPELHKALASHYGHVFFAVWDKRDLFKGHKSAHWCPNATDPRFFYPTSWRPQLDFGFFGSKPGLDRADKMIELCQKHGWTYDVRQIGGGGYKHKWPRTCEAMNNCKVLFNHGQKHDAPNLRVLESMAIGRPLISDLEPRSGMGRLFTPDEHYLAYESYTQNGLEEKMSYAMDNLECCHRMAANAQKLVLDHHLIKNRIAQMLEVFNVK